MSEAGEDGDSETGLLSAVVAVVTLAVTIGLPTVIFGALWTYAFTLVDGLSGVQLPVLAPGTVSAVGAPASLNGVPTSWIVLAGIASTAVWLTLFGTGDSPGKFQSQHREESRFEF